jgi:hypothetical protein
MTPFHSFTPKDQMGIPLIGENGIPVRYEIELEFLLYP